MSKENVQVRTIPFINPPRCVHAVTISRRIVWLGARRIEHVARRSDGAGHQAPFTVEGGGGRNGIRGRGIDLKMSCVISKKAFIFHLSSPPPLLSSPLSEKPEVLVEFAECSYRYLFISVFFNARPFFSPARARVCIKRRRVAEYMRGGGRVVYLTKRGQ